MKMQFVTQPYNLSTLKMSKAFVTWRAGQFGAGDRGIFPPKSVFTVLCRSNFKQFTFKHN